MGIAGIASAAAIGGAAGIAVAATPTSLHGGGLAPDEGIAKVQRGEGTVSTRGVEALARLNRGDAGMGGVEVFVRTDHRVFDAQASEALHRRGSPLKRAVRRTYFGRARK